MTSPPPINAASRQEGKLLGLLLGAGYLLFTLLPDSHSLMVAWPWVFIWQGVVFLPILWLVWLLWYQRRWVALGNGLDIGLGILAVGLIITTLLAEFRPQSIWYGIAAFGGVAAVYALTAWLRTPARRWQLWVFQGYVGVVFSIWSLVLWLSQTLWPELQRLANLSALGIKASLDLTTLEMRNWAPFGHQNYVAGYLLLVLPLLAGLAWYESGRRRWLWLSGLVVGLVAFYFTNSRGGWLGLLGMTLPLGIAFIFGGMKLGRRYRWLFGLGLGSLLLILVVGWSTTRLRDSVWGVLQGSEASELAYRWITAHVGWAMGWSRPWSGTGLGSVPLLYQKFRPAWAGKEAEMVYQLHSTPVQAWAELGIWGIGSGLVLAAVLLYWAVRWRAWWPNLSSSEQLLAAVTGLALWSYGILAVTDYQLDNLGIAGLLALEVAGLAALIRQGLGQSEPMRSGWWHGLGWLGFICLIAGVSWVLPIQRAWSLSSQGFDALLKKPPQWEQFVDKLDQAQAKAPWEPYYPLQLGWNLGWHSLQNPQAESAQRELNQAIAAFRRGNGLSPNVEFGHSNLGWLLLNRDPQAAQFAFARAIELMPARPGIYYGLGFSCLSRQDIKTAQASFLLEVLRQPSTITSGLWRESYLAPLYPTVLNQAITTYQGWITKFPADSPMGQYVRQAYAALIWWQGDKNAIATVLNQKLGLEPSPALPELIQFHQAPEQYQPNLKPQNIAQALIAAWLSPDHRQDLLSQAWLSATQTVIPEAILANLLNSMAQAPNFDTWLRQLSPIQPVQYTRAGFGVLSRHIDGPQPRDFYLDSQNLVISQLLASIWPTAYYLPPLDQTLQPQRQALLDAVRHESL